MALIVCSNCGKEISDKAKTCPNCGQEIVEKISKDEEKIIVCDDCGTEILSDLEACPNCGCPITVEEKTILDADSQLLSSQKTKKSSKKKTIVIIAIVVFTLGIAACLLISSIAKSQEQEKEKYLENLKMASTLMIAGAAKAEDAGNLIKAVWYNTIYEEHDIETDKYTLDGYSFNDDFNDSLYALFADSSFQSKITQIKNNQNSVELIMKELKLPPEEYMDAYESIKDLYDAYLELTGLVINPTGSLTTFSSNFNDADSETIKCYRSMKIYIEE